MLLQYVLGRPGPLLNPGTSQYGVYRGIPGPLLNNGTSQYGVCRSISGPLRNHGTSQYGVYRGRLYLDLSWIMEPLSTVFTVVGYIWTSPESWNLPVRCLPWYIWTSPESWNLPVRCLLWYTWTSPESWNLPVRCLPWYAFLVADRRTNRTSSFAISKHPMTFSYIWFGGHTAPRYKDIQLQNTVVFNGRCIKVLTQAVVIRMWNKVKATWKKRNIISLLEIRDSV